MSERSRNERRGSWLTRVWIVAWRDFRHTVLTKAFLFAIVGVPIMMLLAIGAFALIMATHEEPPLVGTVAVVDRDGVMTEAIRREFEREAEGETDAAALPEGAAQATEMFAPGSLSNPPMVSRGAVRIDVRQVEPATDGDETELPDSLREEVRAREILAAARIPEAIIDPPNGAAGGRFELLTRENLDGDHISLIERVIGRAVVQVRADRRGVDLEDTRALMRRPSSRTRKLMASGEEADQSEAIRVAQQFLIPMAFMMLLWGSTFTGGQHLLNSTIEEKSNKVMEVLLSAVSPLQLMAGKIIGQCLVGLLIVAVYSGMSLAGLVVAARADLIEPIQLVYLAVFFFMAFFMVASLMAAVGSAVSDLREANSLLMPVMLILMLPLMLWFPISQAPNGAVATVFSFIPPAVPFVMILRIAADEAVPLWQILLSIGWGYACVLGMVWMSARIFRVGVLMQGKPPSPLELLRWLRYS